MMGEGKMVAALSASPRDFLPDSRFAIHSRAQRQSKNSLYQNLYIQACINPTQALYYTDNFGQKLGLGRIGCGQVSCTFRIRC